MSNVISVEQIRADFAKIFGWSGPHFLFAQSDQLIGEHTDYNGGHVFPAAISLGTYGAALAGRPDLAILLREFLKKKGLLKWSLKTCTLGTGITGPTIRKEFCIFVQEAGPYSTTGHGCLFMEIFPNGSGLSSSASLRAFDGCHCWKLFDLQLDLVKISKWHNENEFIEVNSALWTSLLSNGCDQRAIYPRHQYSRICLGTSETQDNVLVIMNANKRRELADSKYNESGGVWKLLRNPAQLSISTLGEVGRVVLWRV